MCSAKDILLTSNKYQTIAYGKVGKMHQTSYNQLNVVKPKQILSPSSKELSPNTSHYSTMKGDREKIKDSIGFLNKDLFSRSNLN
mmetsp:Transcript_42942/g.41300  ORF Transcript_42942/g.41300 Transcript_42942/m.41300 type:complete len:85 (+) Transcript_42942:60-314(+)